MIEFIKGEIRDLNPTSVVLENNGMGYFLNISVNTYGEIQSAERCCLYVYEAIREDAYILYGFAKPEEREAFKQLISVSGIGANTARVILSSLNVAELEQAILSENVAVFKNIKGIGGKTAQRLIVELKDKIAKSGISIGNGEVTLVKQANNEVRAEALAALQMLGYQTAAANKVLNNILEEDPAIKVEALIKAALKML